MKILMVCLGNICRSPLAEGILTHKANAAGLNWMIASAGTNSYHTGEPPHPLSQKVAALHGVDISHQRARRFIAADMQQYDLILPMAADVVVDMRKIAGKSYQSAKTALFLEMLRPGKMEDVPDPWYGTEPGYHEVYELIDATCNNIIAQRARLIAQFTKNI